MLCLPRPPLERRDLLRRAHMQFRRVFESMETAAMSRCGIAYGEWFAAYGEEMAHSTLGDVREHLLQLVQEAIPTMRAAVCVPTDEVFDVDGRPIARGDCVRTLDGNVWAVAHAEARRDAYGRLRVCTGRRGMMCTGRVDVDHPLLVDERSRRLVDGRVVDVL